MKKIAVYIRVSTKAQDQRSQEPDLKRWVAGRESEVVWFRDAYTGKTMNRPGMDKLIAEVRAGKIGTIVCWRLDRLGRTARGLTALFEELGERNVGLVSLKDGLDLSTAAGRLMANVLTSVAAFETEVRAERVLAGQAAARLPASAGAGRGSGCSKLPRSNSRR
jgi:DNA invertase Pin-like site-specific DNA recombinase